MGDHEIKDYMLSYLEKIEQQKPAAIKFDLKLNISEDRVRALLDEMSDRNHIEKRPAMDFYKMKSMGVKFLEDGGYKFEHYKENRQAVMDIADAEKELKKEMRERISTNLNIILAIVTILSIALNVYLVVRFKVF